MLARPVRGQHGRICPTLLRPACGRGRRETTTIGTPALSISVAMKWRRSCRRNGANPAARRWRTNAFVTRFGFHAVAPPSSLKMNASRDNPAEAPAAWSASR